MQKLESERKQVARQRQKIAALEAVINSPKTGANARLKAIDRLEAERNRQIKGQEERRKRIQTANAAAVEQARAEQARVSADARAVLLEQRRVQHVAKVTEDDKRREDAARAEAERLAKIPKAWRIRSRELDPITSEVRMCISFVDRCGHAIPNPDGYRLVGDARPQACIAASNSAGKVHLDDAEAVVPWREIEHLRIGAEMQEQPSAEPEPKRPHKFIHTKVVNMNA